MISRDKNRQSRGWGAHFLQRLDRSEEWAPQAWWRPSRDEPYTWQVMWKLFSFNYLLFFLPIAALGVFLSKTWEQSSNEQVLRVADPGSLIPFVVGVAFVSACFDFYACNSLRVAWNRRYRLEQEQELD